MSVSSRVSGDERARAEMPLKRRLKSLFVSEVGCNFQRGKWRLHCIWTIAVLSFPLLNLHHAGVHLPFTCEDLVHFVVTRSGCVSYQDVSAPVLRRQRGYRAFKPAGFSWGVTPLSACSWWLETIKLSRSADFWNDPSDVLFSQRS